MQHFARVNPPQTVAHATSSALDRILPAPHPDSATLCPEHTAASPRIIPRQPGAGSISRVRPRHRPPRRRCPPRRPRRRPPRRCRRRLCHRRRSPPRHPRRFWPPVAANCSPPTLWYKAKEARRSISPRTRRFKMSRCMQTGRVPWQSTTVTAVTAPIMLTRMQSNENSTSITLPSYQMVFAAVRGRVIRRKIAEAHNFMQLHPPKSCTCALMAQRKRGTPHTIRGPRT